MARSAATLCRVITTRCRPGTGGAPAPARRRSERGPAGATTPLRHPPGRRVRTAQDGRWYVDGCPWLSMDANDRRSALEATRAVAEWLGVEPDTFDIEAD